jgi:AAA+ superfamily predicted ATPase
MVMIDEANAYVHERDTNHEQTAIVGVFLRKLEYFRGVLFLATNQTKANQQFDIDEAILSRCVAVIDFDMPTPAEAAQIWIVQCRQQGIVVTKETVRELAQKYNLSGRSIRNLLRLTKAHMLLKNEGDETIPLAVEDVDFCYDVSARLKHEGLRNA